MTTTRLILENMTGSCGRLFVWGDGETLFQGAVDAPSVVLDVPSGARLVIRYLCDEFVPFELAGLSLQGNECRLSMTDIVGPGFIDWGQAPEVAAIVINTAPTFTGKRDIRL